MFGQPEQGKGIDPRPVDPNSPMKVGSLGSSGGTHPAEHRSFLNSFSFLDQGFGEMEIHGIGTPPMIENDRLSGKEEGVNQDNNAVITRQD